MPLRPQPRIMINGREMNLTHHGVCSVIFIQRLWRLSFQHKKTPTLLKLLIKTECRWRDLCGLRLKEIGRRMREDRKWVAHLSLAHRLVMLCQLRCKKNLAHAQRMVRCFDVAHYHASAQVNPFVLSGSHDRPLHGCSVAMLESFDAMVDSLRTSGNLSVDLVNAFNGRITEVSIAFSKTEGIVHAHKNALCNLWSIRAGISEFLRFLPETHIDTVLDTSIEYLTQCVNKETANDKEYWEFVTTKKSTMDGDIIPQMKTNHRFWGKTPLSDIVEYQRLVDPSFVLTSAHEVFVLEMDVFNRNATVLTEVIRSELEANVDATDSIALWHTLAEVVLKRSMPQLDLSGLKRQREELLCSASWDDMLTMMDTIATHIGHKKEVWVRERSEIEARRPNAVSSFVYGLRVLWQMMRDMNIRRANLLRLTTRGQACKLIEAGFQLRVRGWGESLIGVEVGLKETATQYPGLRKSVIQHVKGACLSLHGLFVAHVMFRRDKELDDWMCPATLKLAGPQLVALRKKAHRLSDMAILADACSEDEERANALNYLQRNPGLGVVPIFIPMLSQATVDRAVYADNHTRPNFEKNLVKFLALTAMRRTSQTLPGNLACLQEQLDDIVRQLRVIIELDRCIFRGVYQDIVNRVIRWRPL